MAEFFPQIEGINYEERFALMVRFASIRLLLALVQDLDLELFQMNIKTSCLNSNNQLLVFIKCKDDKVCHLKMFIYGLKKSSKSWYFQFHETMNFAWFIHVFREPLCISEKITFLTLYVHDILQARNNFEIKSMGKAR